MTPSADRPALLGRWRLLRADAALDFAPGVSMEFQPGGRLLYAFDAGDRRQVLPLWYRVEGDQLHTEIVYWIEHTYHRRRRQRALGKLTPIEYELAFGPDQDADAA